MSRRGTVSGRPSSLRYLKSRVTELATAKTRSLTDPLAAWSVKRIRLDGRPFSFKGHEYLRAIFDDTSLHVVLSKAAQIGGTTWAILRSLHACLTGLNVMYFFPTRTDVLEFSNPSLPEYGIDESFQASDQRHWTLKCPACGAWTALEKEFPVKLGEEVRIILPRPDGTFYRACPKCGAELDLAAGEWVADYPDRLIHGYRISQLFSSKVDPGQILNEYRTTKFPDRFYNLKIGIPWADLERRAAGTPELLKRAPAGGGEGGGRGAAGADQPDRGPGRPGGGRAGEEAGPAPPVPDRRGLRPAHGRGRQDPRRG